MPLSKKTMRGPSELLLSSGNLMRHSGCVRVPSRALKGSRHSRLTDGFQSVPGGCRHLPRRPHSREQCCSVPCKHGSPRPLPLTICALIKPGGCSSGRGLEFPPSPRPLSSPLTPPPSARAPTTTVPAAVPEAAAGATAGWIQAKGVPLVDTLMGLPLPVAAARSAVLLIACSLGVAIGRWALEQMDKRLSALMDRNSRARGVQLALGTALVAAHRPVSALLPIYGFGYTLTVLSALCEVAMARLDLGCTPRIHLCGHHLVRLLKTLTQVLQNCTELVLVVAGAWFVVAWKDRLIARTLERLKHDRDPDDDNWERLLLPLSRLVTWVIVGGATVAGLGAVGIDIRPLLALGSVGSLVVGFAAQTTLTNVVSAMSLYTSRPFIVGDRVQLKSLGGTTIAEGVVEKIQPMRTVIRTDSKVPVYINNKDVSNLMIVNESQLKRVNVPPSLASMDATVTVQYRHVGLVPQLEKAVTEYLSSHPDVDQSFGGRCTMEGFTSAGVSLQVKARLTRAASARAAAVRSAILLDVDKVIRSQGARLAISGAEELAASASLDGQSHAAQ